MEVVAQLQIAMPSVFADRGDDVTSSLLGSVFNFREWLGAEGIHLHTCFMSREGVYAVHSFNYKCREDLTGQEAAQVRQQPRFHVPHNEDVFCITKRWMHSDMAAAPVLVLPKERLDRLATPGPTSLKAKKEDMSYKRRQELRDVAQHLEDMTDDWGTEFHTSEQHKACGS